jgi:hypothetical protein
MMPPEDIAAFRGLLQEALGPIKAELEKLVGLPKTVEDLANKWISLNQALIDVGSELEHHGGLLNDHRLQLRDAAPALERLGEVAGKVDVMIPRLERALAVLDNHDGMLGEIRDLNAKRESQRAAGDKT